MEADTTATEQTPLITSGDESGDSPSVKQLEDEPVTGSCGTSACDPTRAQHRYIFMVFLCIVGIGDYFTLAYPAALQDHILEDLNLSETSYMGFLAAVQWAGLIACPVGGYLVDRVFGNRTAVVLFTFLVGVSHALFSAGAALNNYSVMYAGQAFHGIVEAPQAMACENLAVKWFKTKELNMVVGLKTSVARAGSVACMNTMGHAYDYFRRRSTGQTSLSLTMFIGVGVCIFSFLSAIVTAGLDKRADRILHEKAQSEKQEEVIQLRDIKDFPASYWLVAVVTTIYYLGLFPFVGLGLYAHIKSPSYVLNGTIFVKIVYFELKYDLDPGVADNVNSLVYLLAAITMPIFGLMIDKVGRNLLWMFFGIVISLGSHVIMAFTFVHPYLATVMLGTGYSVFTATVWPLISYVIKQHQLGTAFGIMNGVIGVGQTSVFYLTGYLVDTRGYFVTEVFFIASMCVALIIGILLFLVDSANGGVMNLTSAERIKIMTMSLRQESATSTDPGKSKKS